MADSTEGNTNLLYLFHMELIVLIPGLVIHSFIVVTNAKDWWKGRSVSPIDHIVTFLAIARMCAPCINTLIVNMLSLNNLYAHVTRVILDVVYDFVLYANMWLTALLSIVFCLKIYNLHTALFLYLRRMILQRTVYFIVASILLSAFYCLIPLSMTISGVNKGGTYNTTTDILLDCTSINPIYTYAIGFFFPLLLNCISAILLLTLLYHHTTTMKMSSNLTINLQTYYSVMKFVSFTLIYNTIYHIAHFICIVYYYFNCVILYWLYITLDLLQILHSSYLIYRTAKLRNQMSKVLQNITDFLFQRKNMQTRESIHTVEVMA